MKCSLLSWMAVSSVCWWGLTNEIQQQRLSLLCSMDSDGESHRAHGSLQVSPLPSTLTGCSHVSSSWGTSPGSWPALGCYLGDEIELPHPRTHHSSWEHLSVARVHSFLALVMFSLSSLKAPASVLFFFIFVGVGGGGSPSSLALFRYSCLSVACLGGFFPFSQSTNPFDTKRP